MGVTLRNCGLGTGRRSALPLCRPQRPVCWTKGLVAHPATQDDVERHGCREVLVVALHYILKCDVDIRKDLYANVVLHHCVRVIGERMTGNSLHRLPCRLENDVWQVQVPMGCWWFQACPVRRKQDMPVA